MAQAHPHLVFGTSTIGVNYKTPEAVKEVLQVAESAGIREIDTAALYPFINVGESERLLGKAEAAAQGFTIGTKILVPIADPNGSLEAAKINMSVATSQERLRVQKLDTLYFHAPDHTTPLGDQAAAVDALYKKGVFEKLGISNWSLDMKTEYIAICEREGYVKPTVYQGRYNLVCRENETLFPLLRKHNISFYAFSPLAGGFLSGKLTSGDFQGTRFARDDSIGSFAKQTYDKEELHAAVNSLSETLEPAQISKVEASLRWISYHSDLTPDDGIILGASKPQYLVQNVAAIQKGSLPEEIVSAIESVRDVLRTK